MEAILAPTESWDMFSPGLGPEESSLNTIYDNEDDLVDFIAIKEKKQDIALVHKESCFPVG
jgi:hypothetical protein